MDQGAFEASIYQNFVISIGLERDLQDLVFAALEDKETVRTDIYDYIAKWAANQLQASKSVQTVGVEQILQSPPRHGRCSGGAY
jgi:hypothetical protein